MSDAMRFTELSEQYVELLPARTVLSLLHAGTGTNGDPGTPGANGQGGSKLAFLGIIGYGEFDSTPSHGYTFGGTGSSAHGSHG